MTLLMLAVLPWTASRGQQSGFVPDRLMINMRPVVGEELRLYLDEQKRLDSRFATLKQPEDIVRASQQAVREIHALKVDEDVQGVLVAYVGDLAFERTTNPLDLADEFIETGDRDLEREAVSVVWNIDNWYGHEKLRMSLLRLFRDPLTPTDLRGFIVFGFGSDGHLADVEPECLKLVASDGNPELAHEMASSYLAALQQTGHDLSPVFYASSGALREEAAIFIGDSGDSRLENDVFDMLRSIALDGSQLPEVRGRAIEEIGVHAEREENRLLLLELLKPEHWFFGASGEHFKVHSLAVVIEWLGRQPDAEVRESLEEVRSQLPLLPSGEREYVEWVLDNALGNHREIFYGPVKR